MNTVNLVASLHHGATDARRGDERDARLALHQPAFLLISTSSFAVSLLSLSLSLSLSLFYFLPSSFLSYFYQLFFASKRASSLSTFITAHCSLSGNFVARYAYARCSRPLLAPPPPSPTPKGGNPLNVYFFSLS